MIKVFIPFREEFSSCSCSSWQQLQPWLLLPVVLQVLLI
jgi:hypothetical protein